MFETAIIAVFALSEYLVYKWLTDVNSSFEEKINRY